MNNNEEYYLVMVEETLSKTVKVKAKSLTEAEDIVTDAYTKGEIVLDYKDFDNNPEITARVVEDEDLDLYEELN